MAKPDQYLPIRFISGLDTETDPKGLTPGTPTELSNAVFTKHITYEKRFGTKRLDRTQIGLSYAAVSGAIGMATRADGSDLTLLGPDDGVYSYDEGLAAWNKRGDWPMLRQRVTGIPRLSQRTWDPTTASTGSTRLVAWEDLRGGIYGRMFNADSGVAYGREFKIGGSVSRCAKALVVGNQFHVYFVSGTAPNPTLYAAVINPQNPTSTTVTLSQLNSSLSTQTPNPAPLYDVALIGSPANRSLVAAVQSGSIYVTQVASNGSIMGPTPIVLTGSGGITAGSDIAPAVTVSSDGAVAAVVYHTRGDSTSSVGTQATLLNVSDLSFYNGVGTYAVDRDASVRGYGTVNRLTATFVSASLSGSNRRFHVLQELSASDSANRWLRASTCNTIAVSASLSGNLIRHSSLGSEAFEIAGRPFVWSTHVSPLQTTDFLVRADDGLVAARSRYGSCMTDVSGVLGSVDSRVGPNRNPILFRAAGNRDQLQVPGTSVSSSAFGDSHTVLVSTEYHPPYSWQPVDVDGVLHMQGGWLGIYDGTQVVEHGFALDAEGGFIAVGSGSVAGNSNSDPWGLASASNGLGTASISWAAVPEWFDANGNRYLGGFSQLLQTTMSGSETALHSQNSASLTLRTIAHTMKNGTNAPDIRWQVYRTPPNGTVFQNVGFVLNSAQTDTVVFTDTATEVQRSFGEVLYAPPDGSGEDQNSMQASPSTLALDGDRLYQAGLEGEPYAVAVSKYRNGGAANFTDSNVLSVDPVGGPITALASLDDKVVIFKRARLYEAQSSNGPQSNLSSDTTPFDPPLLITSDVGAPEPPVIVQAAGTNVQGLVFVSEGRGVRLLDRGLVSRDIGAPVRQFDGLTFVGGTAPESAEEVRLYTAEGTTLVLNTRFNLWGTFTPQVAVAATSWNRSPTFVGSDGFVHTEDTGSFLDNGTPYSMAITLGWIGARSGLQGVSRFRELTFLGDYYSPHTLLVQTAFDYRDSWVGNQAIETDRSILPLPYGGLSTDLPSDPDTYGGQGYGGFDPVYQERFHVIQQQCQAIRIRITDLNPTGQSFSLSELQLRVQPSSNKARLPNRKITG